MIISDRLLFNKFDSSIFCIKGIIDFINMNQVLEEMKRKYQAVYRYYKYYIQNGNLFISKFIKWKKNLFIY